VKDVLNREKLLDLLSGGLPGAAAWRRLAPEMRSDMEQATGCKEAAVMLLLYMDSNEVRIVFIKRNEYDGPHSGQISFPGGMREPGDRNLRNTALRETTEETGAYLSEENILGPLTPLYIPVSNFCVSPFVAWTDDAPVFDPDESEVRYLVCPLISELLDPGNLKSGTFRRHDTEIKTPYFDIEGERIWGATAMIFSEFMALLGY